MLGRRRMVRMTAGELCFDQFELICVRTAMLSITTSLIETGHLSGIKPLNVTSFGILPCIKSSMLLIRFELGGAHTE